MKRNREKIVRRRWQCYQLNWQKWTTCSSFVDMYNHYIIKDKAIWTDRAGNEFSEDEAYGCKAIYKIIWPDMCIYGDEVGGSLSMKGDGNESGSFNLVRGVVLLKKKHLQEIEGSTGVWIQEKESPCCHKMAEECFYHIRDPGRSVSEYGSSWNLPKIFWYQAICLNWCHSSWH